MRRKVLTLLTGVVLVYVGLCALLFFFQRSLIYFPQPSVNADGASKFVIEVDGERILVTTRPLPGANAVIYFGGNAEDVSYSLPTLSAAFPSQAIYLLHYRGYGGSSGAPSEAALFADSTALYDKVRSEHEHIIVIGRSLGSGVAVHLASVRPVARLVLVTPYDSIQELAANQFPYFPVRWLLRDKFESSKYASAISAPTSLIAAEHDQVVPLASTQALRAHFPEGVATLRVIRNVDHNSISESPEYISSLGYPVTSPRLTHSSALDATT